MKRREIIILCVLAVVIIAVLGLVLFSQQVNQMSADIIHQGDLTITALHGS